MKNYLPLLVRRICIKVKIKNLVYNKEYITACDFCNGRDYTVKSENIKLRENIEINQNIKKIKKDWKEIHLSHLETDLLIYLIHNK